MSNKAEEITPVLYGEISPLGEASFEARWRGEKIGTFSSFDEAKLSIYRAFVEEIKLILEEESKDATETKKKLDLISKELKRGPLDIKKWREFSEKIEKITSDESRIACEKVATEMKLFFPPIPSQKAKPDPIPDL
jgi:hypothetical protein